MHSNPLKRKHKTSLAEGGREKNALLKWRLK
jgi:hypothetical protein